MKHETAVYSFDDDYWQRTWVWNCSCGASGETVWGWIKAEELADAHAAKEATREP